MFKDNAFHGLHACNFVHYGARVPRTSIYYHSELHIAHVLEPILVLWHDRGDKNARQSDIM